MKRMSSGTSSDGHLSTHVWTQALYAAGGVDGQRPMQAAKLPPGHL
jgi:hypothetical protein